MYSIGNYIQYLINYKGKESEKEQIYVYIYINYESECVSHTVMSHSVTPRTVACQAPRPWDFPGENTGVDCRFFLQGIFLTLGSNPHILHWRTDSLPLNCQRNPLFDQAKMYMFLVGQRDSSENNQIWIMLLISDWSHLTCRKEEPQEQEVMGWIFGADGDNEMGGEGTTIIYRVTWSGILSHK